MINMSLLLLRTQYQTAVLSKHNLVVWSTKTFFSFNGNLKFTQTVFSLQWLAAGADFELRMIELAYEAIHSGPKLPSVSAEAAIYR